MARSDLLANAKEATHSPGCYLMKDAAGGVVYVDKAKNLRNRLISYFQSAVHEIPRVELMVSRVDRFEVILTETETEALLLEHTLIKKYKPHFNVRLKDDKAYPYLKIQMADSFPRLEWTRRVLKDGARYFGPFPSAWAARQVLQLLNETFLLRDCSDNTFRHRSRPCILHQIGRCTAPCVGLISAEDYRASLGEVTRVLEGKGDKLMKNLRKQMEAAAEKEDFEHAAQLRDQLRNLEIVTETQGVVEAGSQRDRDVLGLASEATDAHATILRIRGGRLLSVQHFVLNNVDPSVSESELVEEFLSQFYVPLAADPDGQADRPNEVLVPVAPRALGEETADQGLMELLATRLSVQVVEADPKVPADQQLLNVARTNATYALEQGRKRDAGHGIQALEETQEKLQLPKLPQRIECYDISNIQGQDAVASRVVFRDGARTRTSLPPLQDPYGRRLQRFCDDEGSVGPAFCQRRRGIARSRRGRWRQRAVSASRGDFGRAQCPRR